LNAVSERGARRGGVPENDWQAFKRESSGKSTLAYQGKGVARKKKKKDETVFHSQPKRAWKIEVKIPSGNTSNGREKGWLPRATRR